MTDRPHRRDADAVALHVFSTFEPGGAQLRARDLIEAGAVPGRPVIVTLDGGATDPRALLPMGSDDWIALPKAGSVATTRRLIRCLRQRRPSLVLTYDWGAIDAVVANRWSRRAPLVHHEDGVGADEAAGEKRRRHVARRVALRWAHRVIVPSRGREKVAARTWRVPAGRLLRIANGVDGQRFVPNRDPSVRRAWQVDDTAPVLGMLGRLAEVKRVDRALRALALLDPSHGAFLVVAGSGPEEPRLRELAQSLGIADRVRWLGHVDEPEQVLPAFDVFVSSSAREEHPRALLEAMACARPVVASRVGDTAEMLPAAQQPFVVDLQGKGADAVLAGALQQLLGDPAQRDALGRANRERALREHGVEAMRASFAKAYADAARGTAR